MTIANEIARISGAKTDIVKAIEAKGVVVPSETKIDGMADLIGQISGGSSNNIIWQCKCQTRIGNDLVVGEGGSNFSEIFKSGNSIQSLSNEYALYYNTTGSQAFSTINVDVPTSVGMIEYRVVFVTRRSSSSSGMSEIRFGDVVNIDFGQYATMGRFKIFRVPSSTSFETYNSGSKVGYEDTTMYIKPGVISSVVAGFMFDLRFIVDNDNKVGYVFSNGVIKAKVNLSEIVRPEYVGICYEDSCHPICISDITISKISSLPTTKL